VLRSPGRFRAMVGKRGCWITDFIKSSAPLDPE
jgi:hypothetical protein